MVITKTVDWFHNKLKRENERLKLVNFRNSAKVRKSLHGF